MRATKIVLSLLAIALGAGLCFWLYFSLNVRASDWETLLDGLSLPWCLAVFVLSGLLMVSGALKWALLSRAMHGDGGKEPEDGFFFRQYLWQNWIGQFVPPSLAIVGGRAWATRRMKGVAMLSGVGNGFLDQILELAFFVVLLPAAIFVLSGQGGWISFLLLSVAGVGVLAGIMWLGRRRLPAPLWRLFGLSLARVALTILRLISGIYAFGLPIAALAVAAAAPVVSLLSLIPLTPANLGIAEWGWTGLLALAGESALFAALFALGFRLLVFIAQTLLLGLNEGYGFLFRKHM